VIFYSSLSFLSSFELFFHNLASFLLSSSATIKQIAHFQQDFSWKTEANEEQSISQNVERKRGD
jgi:hypothetical protein